MSRLVGGLFLLGLASNPLPAQQTWIVDPNGTGHFTDLAPAIAAAFPGDTLLLLGGNHQGGHTIDKTLAIVGELGAGNTFPRIETLSVGPASAAGQRVSITRITMGWFGAGMPVSLEDVSMNVCHVAATASLHRCTVGGFGGGGIPHMVMHRPA